MNHISAEYHKRAQAFVRANPDMAVSVHSKPDAADAKRENEIKIAWFTYFRSKGMDSTIKTCQHILNGGGKACTFPCENPEHFDGSYVAPRYRWQEQGEGRPVERGDVSDVVQATLDSLRNAVPRGQRKANQRAQEPQQSPQDWLDQYQAAPPPIPVFSDSFRVKFGLQSTGAEK